MTRQTREAVQLRLKIGHVIVSESAVVTGYWVGSANGTEVIGRAVLKGRIDGALAVIAGGARYT